MISVDVEGSGGPSLLLIHGSAADKTTWSVNRVSLSKDLRLLLYDRRREGTPSVSDHADDAASILREHAPEGGFVCGSSYGGVVALELLRRHANLVHGAIILEPPLPATPEEKLFADGLLRKLDAIRDEQGGPAAAEFFLRSVLGDAAYERIPRPFQERSKSMHEAIWRDCHALAAYPNDYDSLRGVKTPVLLVGGERSAPIYRPALELLQRSLGDARLEIIPNAGHMMHAEAHRTFNALVRKFVAEVSAGA